jgi:PAS domain S-box-containing protein
MFSLQEFLESNPQIPEVKTAEQAIDENTKLKRILKEAQERLRAISQSTFEGIVILEDDKIIELNDNFSEIYGYKREEIIGKNLLTLTIPEFSEKVKQHLLSESDKPLEIVSLKKDGSTFDA